MTTIAPPEWFTTALEALREGDVDGFVRMYDDDAIHEFPFAPEGRPERLEGKAAIADYMKNLPALVQLDSFDGVRVREAGDELIVEANGHGRRKMWDEQMRLQDPQYEAASRLQRAVGGVRPRRR
ncbi:MAG: nuclear transport factor 2 family protein [Polyangiaceae bacterium]